MANDEGKKEDKFDFTDEGEARYIGLDEARILAMQAADETPGDYGRQFRRDRMAFEPQDVEETDEYYRIVLAVRPQGDFNGAPGREEFYVEKLAQAEGAIAHRQVLAVPVPEQSRRLGLVLASVAVLVVIIASGVVGGLYFGGILPPSDSSDDTAVSTPAPAPPTPVPPVAPAPDPVEVMVSPQAPSKLTTSDNSVVVDVPAGAVPELATLRFEPVTPQLVPRLAAGYSRVVRAFSLDITTAQQLRAVSHLEQPITLTLSVTDADIQLAGGDGENLIIQHFKPGQDTGEPLDTSFDAQAKTVSAEVASLSIFALTVRSEGAPQAQVTPTPDITGAATSPTVTPTPILTDEPPTATPNPAFFVSRTPTPTPVGGFSVTTRPIPTPTRTPTPTPVPTLEVVATRILTPTPSPSPTLTPTRTRVVTRTPTRTPRPTPIPPTSTPSPTLTPLPPNLLPFQPERWSAPLVISDTRSPFLDTPPPGGTEFVLGSQVFVHWAIKNEGRQAITQPFQVGIAIDGKVVVTFPVERMDSNEIARMVNVELSVDTSGDHLFELVVDIDNRIAERNERDNRHFVNARWAAPTPTPTPTHTLTPTVTPTPTITPTLFFAPTSVVSPTATRSAIPTLTPTPTGSSTPSPTATHTAVPTETGTIDVTSTPTSTGNPTPAPTNSPTPTIIPTSTATPRPFPFNWNDEFDGPSPGYDSSMWSEIQGGSSGLSWADKSKMLLETFSSNGWVKLVSSESFVIDKAEFRAEGSLSANVPAVTKIGWYDPNVGELTLRLKSGGLIVTTGTGGSKNNFDAGNLNPRIPRTYRLERSSSGKAQLYADGVLIHENGGNLPSSSEKLPFVIYIEGGRSDLENFIEVDYVSVNDVSVLTLTHTPVPYPAGTLITSWGVSGTPRGIAVDRQSNVYVTNVQSDSVIKYSNTGTLLTQWGREGTVAGDFKNPIGVAIDSDEYVFVTDDGNNRVQKFTSGGIFISQFYAPGNLRSLAIDQSGYVYIVRDNDGTLYKYDSDGNRVTQWDIGANNWGIALDDAGNVYVGNGSGVDTTIMKFTSDGELVSTIGKVVHDPAHPGSDEFKNPRGLATDHSGNLFLADNFNERILKFSPEGIFLAKWNNTNPYGIAVGPNGNVYVVNSDNNRITVYGGG